MPEANAIARRRRTGIIVESLAEVQHSLEVFPEAITRPLLALMAYGR
jgi:hypothetical protein